jgi:hypothetical protein
VRPYGDDQRPADEVLQWYVERHESSGLLLHPRQLTQLVDPWLRGSSPEVRARRQPIALSDRADPQRDVPWRPVGTSRLNLTTP